MGSAALLAVPFVGARPALAIDQSHGTPGFCSDATGVTVVVDFQQLGGEPIVRCYHGTRPGTGLDALEGAGFQIAGVQRWGDAFICRIENRPSAVESVPIQGNPNYHERCIDTPPAKAYWSYWVAGNNCPWDYSQWGVKNRRFIPGGFEGWSFSLNATADTNPIPRIAASRPGTAGQACTTAPQSKPTSTSLNETEDSDQSTATTTGTGRSTSTSTLPGGSASQGSVPGTQQQPETDPESTQTISVAGQTSRPGAGTASVSTDNDGVGSGTSAAPPLPRSAGTASAVPSSEQTIAYTGGQNSPNVNDELKKQAHASDYAPWVAVGVVVALGTLAGVTSRRRRRARDGE